MKFLVTESEIDARLWKILLRAAGLDDVRCAAAGGQSSALSLARSLIFDRPDAVALVLDSHSVDEDSVEEQRIVWRDLLLRGGVRGPAQVFLTAPEAEALLFEHREFVERALGPLDERTLLLGKIKPRRVVEERLGHGGREEMLRRLDGDPQAATAIARTEIVTQVADFLRRPHYWRPSAAPALSF